MLMRVKSSDAWFALRNRLWTAKRLQTRGWPNCGLRLLYKQTIDRLTTSSSIVGSTLEFESFYKNNLVFKGLTLGNVRT
jgi:hypothetical protein